MNKKRLLIALCLVAFSAAALGYSRSQMQGRAPAQPQRGQPPQPTFRQQDIYEHMFRHYTTLKNRAAEAEREGRDGSELRGRYRREAALNEQEARLLDEVAAEAISRLMELDARAQQIIAEARARVPGGRLQEGQEPPPPPAELTTLQEEREALVLRARERLEHGFGAASFARFDEFVRRNIGGNMRRPAAPFQHQPRLLNQQRPPRQQ